MPISYIIEVLLLVALFYFILRWTGAIKSKPKNVCPHCGGKGYWLGLRERERCNECNGTGKTQ
ncbi:MAG TPA: hypothetical protein ENJ95_09930 [Bacteroidetes bacterium]|nr:hypothetical protein [Bacteroidota bacterium]